MHTDINDEVVRIEETRYLLQSPGFVAMLSGLIMGLGQFFNGQVKKSLVFFFAEIGIFLYFLDYLSHRIVADTLISFVGITAYHVFLGTLVAGGVLLWLFNIFDAYRVAQFLSFIYDRSIPQMVDDDESFYASQIEFGGSNFKIRKGFSRKSAFLVTAITLYTLGLMSLGSRFLNRSEEMGLRAAIERNPQNATAHLRLGELYLAHEQPNEARTHLQTVLELAEDNSETRLAYRALTSLARAYAEMEQPDQANEMLKRALTLSDEPLMTAAVEQIDPILTPPVAAPTAGTESVVGGIEVLDKPSAPSERPVRITQSAGETTDLRLPAPDLPLPGPAPRRTSPQLRAMIPGPIDSTIPDAMTAAPPENSGSYQTRPVRPGVSGTRDSVELRKNLMRQAETAVSLGNIEEARRLLALALRKGEDGLLFHVLSGRVAIRDNDHKGVVSHLSRALELGNEDPEIKKLLALSLIQTGDKKRAADLLDTYLQAATQDRSMQRRLIDLDLENGNYTRANKNISDGLIDRPNDTALLAREFIVALAARNEERGFQTGLKIIKLEPDNRNVVKGLNQAALDGGYPELGARLASAYIEEHPTRALGYLLKARVLMAHDDRYRALSYFEKASALGSDDPEVFYETGRIYAILGRPQDALKSLKAALALDPKNPQYLKNMGKVGMETQSFAEALQAYDTLEAMNPSDENALSRARALLALRRPKDAHDALKVLLTRDPNNSEARHVMASIPRPDSTPAREPQVEKPSSIKPPPVRGAAVQPPLAQPGIPSALESGEITVSGPEPRANRGPQQAPMADPLELARQAQARGRLPEAVTILSQAARSQSHRFEIHTELAKVLKTLDRGPEAIQAYEAARRIRPDDVAVLMELGELYTALNRPSDAVSVLERLVSQDPKNLAGRYALGVNYEKLRNFDGAEEQYKTLTYHYPRFIEAHDYLGNLYFSRGKYPLASKEYEKVLAEKPKDPTARFKYAISLLKQDDRQHAVKELEHLKIILKPSDALYDRVSGYLSQLGVGD